MKNVRRIKKGKRITLILALFLFSSYYVSASPSVLQKNVNDNKQTYYTIKGKVIDSKSDKELVFASVSAVGCNVGTVTNTEGEFTLKISNKLDVTDIAFSYIGYKNKTVKVNKFNDNITIVKLIPVTIPLNEIVIRPTNPKELIMEVLNKINENYSNEANSLMAFYRETIKQRRKYVSISEAVVEIYKAPYNKSLKNDLVKLYKGRKSANVKKQDTLIMKLRGGPRASLLLDIAKNPYILISHENINDYEFEIKNIININDKMNYVIEFKQIAHYEYPLYYGKLFVNIESLAITAAEFSLNLDNEEEASRMFVRKKPLSLKLIPTRTKYLVKYKEQNGKYYFNYARGEVKFKCKWNKRLFNSNYTVMTEIAVTDRTKENVKSFSRTEQLKYNSILADKVEAFADKNFWGEYNLIKPNESIENAIKKYGNRLKKTE